MAVTIEALRKKYDTCIHYIQANERISFESTPENAKWIDKKVLARWLYESSKEWIRDYQDTLKKVESPSEVDRSWEMRLNEGLRYFKKGLQRRFRIKLD